MSNKVSILLLFFSFLAINAFSQTYTFTSAGATGRFGPSQTQINLTYTNTNLNGQVTTTNGIQSWTVPSSGPYRIETRGAKGGNGQTTTGSTGAIMRGDFTLTAGQVLKILVGQSGSNGNQGGGGGGSYVTDNSSNPLCIAGGGGGSPQLNSTSYSSVNMQGTVSASGQGGVSATASVIAGVGGTVGTGGSVSTIYTSGQGSGGGGLTGNGVNGIPSNGGTSFINGGTGGLGGTSTVGIGGDGGFGGGGGGDWTNHTGSGGGGGYSGGGGGVSFGCGGGGGSFNSGTNQLNSSGTNSTTGIVIITKLSGINFAQTSSISCNGQLTAALSASAYGGTAPYTYSWMPGNITTNTIGGLGAGVYTCSALDASLVPFTATFAILQPPTLSVSVATKTNVSCYGGSNGAVNITTTGGTGAYSYTWSPSGGNSANAVNLVAGNYTLSVKDQNNCSTSLTTAITQPTPFVISGFATNPTVCLGGTSILLGAGALTYTWSGGVTNGVSFTPSASTIYTLTGTNASGCVSGTITAITVNTLPIISVTGPASVCAGATLVLTASGATSYIWNGSFNTNSLLVSPLVNTVYTVTGTGANACQATITKTVTVVNPPTLSISASAFSVCQGQTLSLLATGANSYTWSNGISNGVPFTASISTTYSVTGENSCGSNSKTTTVTVQPLPVLTVIISNPSVCSGQSLSLIGSGATGYSWSGAVVNGIPFVPLASAVYTLTGTNACGNSTTTASVTVNPLPPVNAIASSLSVCPGGTVSLQGTGALTYTWTGGITNNLAFAPASTASYSLSGTDANGCINSVIKTIHVNQPPVLVTSANPSVMCFGTAVTLSGSGASTYTWTGGVLNNVAFTPIASATYSLTGENACGTASAVISITVNPLPNIGATAVNPVICIGGTTALQGSGAQSYLWTGGRSNNVAFSPTVSATYFVIGTDVNGCQNSSSVSITVNTLPLVTANATSTLVCLGNTVSLYGGGAVSYFWSGGVTDNNPFSPPATAAYTVTGTDINGCMNTAVRSISVANVPLVSANSNSPVVCFGQSTSLFGSGAATYSWTGSVTNNTAFTPTATAAYTVNGTNACGTATAAITISVNTLPNVFAIASPTVVCAGSTLVLIGGGASTYTWSGGAPNNTPFAPAQSTTYTLTGTGSNGCKNTALQSVSVNPLPIVFANASSTFICVGSTVTLSGSGADTYSWSGGVNAIAFTPTLTTTYSLSGTNTLSGCTSTNVTIRTITVNPLPIVTTGSAPIQVCAGNSITLSGTGASTYSWTGGVTNNLTFVPVSTNTYSVNGTNTLTGCSNTNVAVITVSVLPRPTVSLSVTNPVICLGQTTAINASGADTYTISGGLSNGQAFNPTTSNNYTVTGTNTLTGCSNTNIATVGITVHPSPVVVSSAINPVVCVGNTVILSAGGADTYTWSGGVTNGQPFIPLTSGTFTVAGTNTITGCVSGNNASQSITVNPLPTITVSNSNTTICSGQTISLVASGADTYTWSGGAPDLLPFSPTSSAVYSVSGSNSLSGCSNTSTTTVSITVNPLPTMSVFVTTPSLCLGNSVILQAIGIDTYTWTNNVINGISFSPTLTATYTCTGTNTLTSCTNTITQTIVVNTLPTVSINASTLSLCAGGTVALTASGAGSYTWSNGVANGAPFIPLSTLTYSVIGTNTAGGCTNLASQTVTVFARPSLTVVSSANPVCFGNTVSLTASGADTYTWSGGISNGAGFIANSTQTYSVSGTKTLGGCTSTINPVILLSVSPLPTLAIVANPTALCAGESLSLTVSGADTYTWYNGSVDIQVVETPSLPGNYTYAASGTGTNGCKSLASITQSVSECTALEKQVAGNLSFQIFPNPSRGEFYVICESEIILTLYNETGQLVRTLRVGANDEKIVISGLANGIYFIYGHNQGQVIKRKVIVER